MGRPLSMDLRERVLAAIEAGETRQSVADRFAIDISSVGRYIRRKRDTGSLEPGKMGGHRKPRLAEHEALVRELVQHHPDATLDEIKARLARQGIRIGRTSVFRFLRDLGLSYKKNAARG